MATLRGDKEQHGYDPGTDEEVVARVRKAFSDNLELQTTPIDIIACQGVVELRGAVPDAELRQLAAQLAASAKGVRNIVNHVNVTGDRA